MVNVMLYSNFSEFNEICRALGLKDVTITKLQNAKKLQLLDTPLKNGSVAYVEAKKMLSDINMPKRAYIFVREEDSYEYKFSAIIVKKPSFVFWSLYEFLERAKKLHSKSIINPNCVIGNNTSISKTGVIIEDDVIIDDNVIIKEGVVIKKGTKIGPGCVIGSNGLEVKDTIFGKIIISHKGGVVINENVEMGALCTINQGIGEKMTQIGSDTKLDCGVHIAHSCSIGSENIITANVTFGGSVLTGSNVFFGLNATIRNGVKLADGCFVGAGSVVTKDVKKNALVFGCPAKFIRKVE